MATAGLGGAGGVGCSEACPSDVNSSGDVNIDDLVSVITAWGACTNCPANPCTADVTGDCQVNIDDLVGVITNWG